MEIKPPPGQLHVGASEIADLFLTNKIGLRCPCTHTNLAIKHMATFQHHSHVAPFCEIISKVALSSTLAVAIPNFVSETVGTLCDMVDGITEADLSQMKNTVIRTLVATDEVGLRDTVQRNLDGQQTAYRRAFTLANSIVDTKKRLDDKDTFKVRQHCF